MFYFYREKYQNMNPLEKSYPLWRKTLILSRIHTIDMVSNTISTVL